MGCDFLLIKMLSRFCSP